LADFSLRPAIESDKTKITDLIHRSGINPMDLDWRRFVVVEQGGAFAGCGQLKPHGDDSLELASIAVEKPYRGQGVARLIITHLLAQSPRPLYLTCRSSLGALYEKFGFHAIDADEMPAYFRRISRLAKVLIKFMRPGEHLLVMCLD
jgi:N-acetylglutamate synthase-like GNAT family acetyltransferase